ncbi:phosphatidylinositol 4-kinase gamma 6-like [Zingiber officinale]|uniref:1-phosphatidylinositol 4-kinase n=1 Tax=Zingiber officinale TaxID=94328 RepID=A0A8J5H2H2_ZINOF|nr:phosphatidylinositol 4-kinase gamma 6-like [Zingiber officinale]KAG6519596.1 hypothetical protein ZIOFF_023092 [Zingiber officinale]
MAVSIFNRSISSDYNGSNQSEGKPSGRRRVFVQTETGCVLGIELDRGDNVHTVKRRLQIALNVPTEESSLTVGDLVLKNDLSAVRNDSPLLLTRNALHRSSSTPCLSPTGKDIQQRDRSGPIEILVCSSRCCQTKELVKDVVKAIKIGIDPIPVHSGLGGAYYFRNIKGESVAIVKPTDEEPFAPNNPKGFTGKALGQPGLKRSVRVGETGFREVAAYLLDYDHFANVPPTVLVKITHSVFNVNEAMNYGTSGKGTIDRKRSVVSKIASFQQFIPHDFDASDHGTSSFSVAAVHRIGILDIRIFNTDRHAGNLLVKKCHETTGGFGVQTQLIPIDHGLCLPESLEDPYFEWIHWPQASIPFSEDELKYIANLDPVKDSEMLRMELPMIREACLRVLILSTIFLKEAAVWGLCLADIGEMMSREFKGMEEEPSELEVVCIKVRRLIAERSVFSPVINPHDDDAIQFDIECEEDDALTVKSPSSYYFGSKGKISKNPLSRLDESFEEELEDEVNGDSEVEEHCFYPPSCEWSQHVPSLTASLKGISLTRKNQHCPRASCAATRFHNGGGASKLQVGNSRSANEPMPTSVSFVKLADMGEEEWSAFLEKFQELLQDAFHSRKSGSTGLRQKQRLGTSCQF